MNNGYIKLFRKINEWEWYQDSNTFRLFIHCLIKANHKDKKWQGILIKRGEFLTSSLILAKELGITRQQIRTSIKKLISTNEITSKSTNKNTVITVLNYENYQGIESQSTSNITINQPADNQQVTTTKNVKNNKNDKNKNTMSFSENEKEDTDNSIKQIIDYLNLKNNSNYRYNSKKTISLIKARLKEGFIFNDFKIVIDNKVDEWSNDNKMSKFLRPVTLFAEKFESYLNEKKFENNKPENNDDKFYLIEEIIAEGKYRSESQLHLLPEREASFIESLPCGFVTVNELSGNEFEYNKLKKQYKNFIKE